MEIVGILHAEEAAEIQASPGKFFNDLEKQQLLKAFKSVNNDQWALLLSIRPSKQDVVGLNFNRINTKSLEIAGKKGLLLILELELVILSCFPHDKNEAVIF